MANIAVSPAPNPNPLQRGSIRRGIMTIRMLPALGMLLFLGLHASAQDRVIYGPQAGEKLKPFKVFPVAGPDAGKEKDFLAEFKGAPTVLVFFHTLERSSQPLIRAVDQYTA